MNGKLNQFRSDHQRHLKINKLKRQLHRICFITIFYRLPACCRWLLTSSDVLATSLKVTFNFGELGPILGQ